jgi:hypothetical protein
MLGVVRRYMSLGILMKAISKILVWCEGFTRSAVSGRYTDHLRARLMRRPSKRSSRVYATDHRRRGQHECPPGPCHTQIAQHLSTNYRTNSAECIRLRLRRRSPHCECILETVNCRCLGIFTQELQGTFRMNLAVSWAVTCLDAKRSRPFSPQITAAFSGS